MVICCYLIIDAICTRAGEVKRFAVSLPFGIIYGAECPRRLLVVYSGCRLVKFVRIKLIARVVDKPRNIINAGIGYRSRGNVIQIIACIVPDSIVTFLKIVERYIVFADI